MNDTSGWYARHLGAPQPQVPQYVPAPQQVYPTGYPPQPQGLVPAPQPGYPGAPAMYAPMPAPPMAYVPGPQGYPVPVPMQQPGMYPAPQPMGYPPQQPMGYPVQPPGYGYGAPPLNQKRQWSGTAEVMAAANQAVAQGWRGSTQVIQNSGMCPGCGSDHYFRPGMSAAPQCYDCGFSPRIPVQGDQGTWMTGPV